MQISNSWLVLAAMLAMSCAARAESPHRMADPPGGPDIFGIWDQFAISDAAAALCRPADAPVKTRHAANFAIVATHVRQRIRAVNPSKSNEQIGRFLSGRQSVLARQTHEHVKQAGCADGQVQQIVDRYLAQARWQPPAG